MVIKSIEEEAPTKKEENARAALEAYEKTIVPG
jgi:hypothetical protein